MSAGKRMAQGPLSMTSDEDSGSDTNQEQEDLPVCVRPNHSRLSKRAIAIIEGRQYITDENMNRQGEPQTDAAAPQADYENHAADIDHEEVVGDEAADTPDTPETPVTPMTDHDYDQPVSPASSTASGPVYRRPPGFSHHAHELARPRGKKKKGSTGRDARILRRREPTPPKARPKREPVPMRLRALPQSFWQQPNVSNNVSPGNAYPVLPPLKGNEDLLDVRPITPPGDREEQVSREADRRLKPAPPGGGGEKSGTKITVGNTDLLHRLFDVVDTKREREPRGGAPTRTRKTRKVIPSSNRTILSGEDPHMVEGLTDKLFPTLTLEGGRAQASSHLQLLTVRDGEKFVTLPALGVEQNYSQMLSELVMHI